MRPADRIARLLLVVALPGAVHAAACRRIDLPAGRLGDATIALAQAGDASIGLTGTGLPALATAPLHGCMSVARALRLLLRELPARAERIDGASWRIVPAPSPLRGAATSMPPAIAAPDIVVTGSKTGAGYDRYPGTVAIIDGGTIALPSAALGTAALVARVPTLTQTNLGSGRNKLFIRGIADSSFNGPSQATVGQYLGEIRLNYNAPDPDLSLYDIRSVELLEGPQGSLYGVGALGGVIRILPNPVDLTRDSVDLGGGVAATAHGNASYDLVGVVNLAAASGAAGLRIVAFDTRDGGYIDDPARGRSDINRTTKHGGRAAARVDAGDWTIDAGGVVQNIATRDGQYSDVTLPRLERRSRVDQPFDNDYAMGQVTASRRGSGLDIVVATGVIRQSVDSRFDFTPDGASEPRVFDQHNRIWLISNESRVSRRDAAGRGWVAGVSLLYDEERLTRALGDPADPPRILGVANSVTQAALFGESGVGITRRLLATVGGRIEFAHLVGEPLDRAADNEEPRRDEVAFLPSLALSWRPIEGVETFVRYQEGYRPGGLSVVPGTGAPAVQRFRGDSLASLEAGAKLRRGAWEAGLTLSRSHWESIQADLVNAGGLPLTATIGNGRVLGAEGHVGWTPTPALRVAAAIFVNDSELTAPAAGFADSRGDELPNIAHVGITGTADYSLPLRAGWRIDGGLGARYVGHSRLGIGTLDILQGNYTLAQASVRIGTAAFGMTVSVDNMLDSRGSTFALGNPFGVAAGHQEVPPRPRTVRLGVDGHF